MAKQTKYPASEGWIHARLKMPVGRLGTSYSNDQIKKFLASPDSAHNFEYAVIHKLKSVIRVIYRYRPIGEEATGLRNSKSTNNSKYE